MLPPLWFDIVSDLTMHIQMANRERPPAHAEIVAILTDSIQAVLRLQSDAELGRAQQRPSERELAKALRHERERRQPAHAF